MSTILRYFLFFGSVFWIRVFAASEIDLPIDLQKGQQLYYSCSACHGESANNTVGNFPKLAGQNPRYLVKQLQDYQTHRRENAVMEPIAHTLTPNDTASLIAYLNQFKSNTGIAEPKQLLLGEKLYRAGSTAAKIPACAACHGSAGLGNNQASIPALAGQNTDYTVTQLTAFQQHTRHNDPNKMMQTIAARLSDQDKLALANFIHGLHE
jgi:cytochrome c553